MDEYEFLETEAGSGERGSGGRNREVTPLRKQQQGQGGGQGGNNRANTTQESPLRRALEQPPLKRFKVTFNLSLTTRYNSFEVRTDLCSSNHHHSSAVTRCRGLASNPHRNNLDLTVVLTQSNQSNPGLSG